MTHLIHTMKNKLHIVFLSLLISLVSCTKKEEDKPAQETGTVTDVEGHVYKTVKIGNQWWMAEDLKTTKYRSGTSIRTTSDTLEWESDTTGMYYDKKNNNNVVIGKYYNDYVITNANQLAPEGWHLPSDAEWKELERSIGINTADADNSGWRGSNEGDKLKIKGPDGWTASENVWGTNESGFTALATGCVLFNFKLADPGYFATGFWWTSTTHENNEAWYRYLDYKKSSIFRSHCLKGYGYSVRCVKDQ